jgi:hypothetical protein
VIADPDPSEEILPPGETEDARRYRLRQAAPQLIEKSSAATSRERNLLPVQEFAALEIP